MIVAQERGVIFIRDDEDESWEPQFSKANQAWDDMEEAMGLVGLGYQTTLTTEGEAFRARIVAYVPPEEVS